MIGHSWEISIPEATALQKELASRIVLRGNPRPRLVAGVDCGVPRGSDLIKAVVLIYDLAEDRVLETARADRKARFPYVPGFLTFREGPAVLEAFGRLSRRPDAVIFDGQGIAHPRRFGIAAHLGLWLGIPSAGCAKSRLCGNSEEPGTEAGSSVPLLENGELIGTVLRTKTGVKPVFVSPGHLVSQQGAVDLVLGCCRGYRLPEPTRLAHLEASIRR